MSIRQTSSFSSNSKRILSTALLLSAFFIAKPLYSQVNLPTFGGSNTSTVSSQQEYEFGRELIRSMKGQIQALDDPLIEEYIASLSYKLAVHSELRDHRLDFLLIDSEALNAFAAPGGIVGVNAGLFLYAENEGQFASVLAHELAHLSQRHYARNVEQVRNNALPNLAATVASLIIMATVDGEAGQAALAATQTASIEGQLRYSRNNEQEADRVGIRTLYNAGFNPADMGGMFEKMMRSKSFSQKPPEFLSTHPLDEDRIADSKNRTNNYPRVQHIQDIEYLLMQQRVAFHYQDKPEDALVNLLDQLPQLNGIEADAAQYAIALNQMKSGQFVNASQSIDTLLKKNPTRISYVMLNAEIAQTAGNYDLALKIIEDNLQINPSNYPLSMSYANVLIDAKRYPEAIDVLKKLSITRPNDMSLWYLLAETQGLANNISGVHQARAEYFLSVGELGRARDQLNFALTLDNDSLTVAKIKQRLEYIREIGNRFYR